MLLRHEQPRDVVGSADSVTYEVAAEAVSEGEVTECFAGLAGVIGAVGVMTALAVFAEPSSWRLGRSTDSGHTGT